MGTRPDLAPCRGCRARSSELVVDLGRQSASDFFPSAEEPEPDPRWPLELWLCGSCGLVQLGPVEPLLPEPVLAIESATSLAHAATSVTELLVEEPSLVDGTVFEFRSHHGGSWTPALARAGCRVLDEGSDEAADLVVDVHALAHESDVHAALAARRQRMAPQALLVLECHHLLALLRGHQFDTVRHGHWSYLSLTAIRALAARQGLEPVRAVQTDSFGGSLRVVLAAIGERDAEASVATVMTAEAEAGVATRSGLLDLQRSASEVSEALRTLLATLRSQSERVLAYGAPSKATVLLGVAGIGRDLLEFTVDASPAKHGRVIPGCRIPIRPVPDLRAARPDVVLLLTWDLAHEVVNSLEADSWGARYVVPFPSPHYWPG